MTIFNPPAAVLPLYRFSAALLLVAAAIVLRSRYLPAAPLWAGISAYALLPCLLLPALLIAKIRTAVILGLCFSISLWRADMALPAAAAEFSCTGQWQVADFPQRNLPLGQRLKLRLHSGDCPQLRSQTLIATHYSRDEALAMGMSFHAALDIRAAGRGLYADLPRQRRPAQAALPPISAYRAALAERIDTLFPQRSAWVRALLIGDRSQLSQRMRQALQHTGSSHLLAISGLHLAVMMGLVYGLAKAAAVFTPLRYCIEPRSMALTAALFAGLLFALISGAQPPVLRAWIMFACLLLAWLNLLPGGGIRALCCALLLILLIDPAALFALSTWLSFLATAAVILILRRIGHLPLWQQWILLQSGITLVLLPLTWSIFGGIALLGIAVNLIVVPWLAPLLCLLLAALLWPGLAGITGQALAYYLRPIELAAQWPPAYFEPAYQPPLAAAVCLCLALLCLLGRLRRTAAAALLTALLLALPPLLSRQDYVLPGRRIPAAILYPPSGAPIILNSGYHYRERNDARRYLLPLLRQRWQRPQAIILTHDSPYAVSGLATLLAAYPGTPVYTLRPMPKLSFAHQYCPELPEDSDFSFRRGSRCSLYIGGRSYRADSLHEALPAAAAR